jgi:beta-glucanase (GH16 family)
LEWYDPQQAITKDGALEITLEKKESHGLHYEGGLISTWNKFCFTGGMVLSSVTLPGAANVQGLWPAIWAMGNLGRAGYGASLDGTVCSPHGPFHVDNIDPFYL